MAPTVVTRRTFPLLQSSTPLLQSPETYTSWSSSRHRRRQIPVLYVTSPLDLTPRCPGVRRGRYRVVLVEGSR
jgi:hypothetical protein